MSYEKTKNWQRFVLNGFAVGSFVGWWVTAFSKTVFSYHKPLHTLRKSCITDWAGQYPMHVVKEWAGHANIATTQQFYLKVQDSDYERAATSSFWKKVTENVTENGKNGSSGQPEATNKETQATD